MLRNIIAFPLLALVVMLQSAVVSRITLLAGYADLVLVILAAWALNAESTTSWVWGVLAAIFVSFVSKLPWPVIFVGYLFVIYFAQLLRQRVWQAPLLAMFSVVFIGSLLMNVSILLLLTLLGRPLPFGDSFGLIILPSALLNLLFSIPVFAVIQDLAKWVAPVKEIE